MKPEKKTPFFKAWMPWYGDDFFDSFTVKQMSLEEEAVYQRWLWAAWCDKSCSLPGEEHALRNISGGFTGDFTLLLSCWYQQEGRLYNERLLEEWQKAKEISRIKTAAVKTRYPNASTDVPTSGLLMTLHTGYHPHPHPSSQSKKQTQEQDGSAEGETEPASATPERASGVSLKKKSAAMKIEDDPDFEVIRAAYPRHEGGKKKAREAWDKTRGRRPPLADLLAAIETQRHGETWAKGFIPHLGNWLAEERWTDEPKAMPDALLCQAKVKRGSVEIACLGLAHEPKGQVNRSRIPRCLPCYEEFWQANGRRGMVL